MVAAMDPIAPPITRSGQLILDDGQSLYWEESGRPDGIPALYLHGGPGGGLRHRGYAARFDPERYRIISFEQRGCGRSTPLAGSLDHDLDANTTPRLLTDIETLRAHLGVDSWVLNGVSWGTTLALAYAQAHPDRVLGLGLAAVTTTSQREVDWITEGVGAVYPEAWDRFASFAEQAGIGYRRGAGRLVTAYARLLRDADPAVRRSAADSWAEWEDVHVSIGAGGYQRNPRWDDPVFTAAFSTLTSHYWSHDGFLDPPLLDRMDRLSDLPGLLAHGRRDISSPAVTAWELHRRWPGSRLVIDEGDGHGGPTMMAALIAANARFADQIG